MRWAKAFDGSNTLPANAYSIEKGADQISMRVNGSGNYQRETRWIF